MPDPRAARGSGKLVDWFSGLRRVYKYTFIIDDYGETIDWAEIFLELLRQEEEARKANHKGNCN